MITTVKAVRYHDISCGHRVAMHESRCAHIHGHNYRITFTCTAAELDSIGRVIDFTVMKAKLCLWLEDHWDHRFLAWEQDTLMRAVNQTLHDQRNQSDDTERAVHSIVWVPFNPTAENIANHLLRVVGPEQLAGTGVRLIKVTVDETRKCSASAEF